MREKDIKTGHKPETMVDAEVLCTVHSSGLWLSSLATKNVAG